MIWSRTYTLRKSKQILIASYQRVQKKREQLSSTELEELREQMRKLKEAIDDGNRESASRLAEELRSHLNRSAPRGQREALFEFLFALGVALLVAIAVRQSCFEPMTIPTGSMRPTLREEDMLIVSKTNFGINVPLRAQHVTFDPDLVERTKIIVWTGHNVDLPNTDTLYFWLFPTKKPYVKRLIGKPGDTLYFYGGQIWGLDKEGAEIPELRTADAMQPLEHIPFQQFEGRIAPVHRDLNDIDFYFRHFNNPIGRLRLSRERSPITEIFDGEKWISEDLQNTDPHALSRFSDRYGIGNYAMARMLTREQIQEGVGRFPAHLNDAPFYLELRHSPTLSSPAPSLMETPNGTFLVMHPQVTWLPLQEEDLDHLRAGLYTARFVVNKERAVSYSQSQAKGHAFGVPMPGVPDGTYELYYGKAYHVGFWGRTTPVADDHPLAHPSPALVQTLFNQGISFLPEHGATRQVVHRYPHRYVYYRNGTLYTMGVPLLEEGSARLTQFVADERERAAKSSRMRPYTPFVDQGPPLLEDGSLDRELIQARGLRVPDDMVLVLGDNHAMSADSRWAGMIPEDNLAGAPSYLLWPWNDRGPGEVKPAYPWITTPRILIWVVIGIGLGIWWWISRRKEKELEAFLC